MKKITTLLFDLDGTIINTPELIMNSFMYSIKENTNYKLTKDEITNVLGHTLDKAFEPYAKDLNHLNKMIQLFRDYSNKNGSSVLVYDDVYETLDYLLEKGYVLGIVTSKSKNIAMKNINDLKLNKYFSTIITYEDTLLHKPNKEPLYKALDLLNKTNEEAIYIGDHDNDVRAGKNASMKTGLMKYSHRFNDAIELKPDIVFESFKSIKELF